jgi:hypothetical protein
VAAAVNAYDVAVRDSLGDLMPGIVDRMHKEAADALTAIEAARVSLSRALSSRAVAYALRESEVYAACVAAGVKPGTDYAPIEATQFVRSVGEISVREKAARAVALSFADAPPIAETAANLETVADALQAMSHEDPSAPWTLGRLGSDDVALALGLALPQAPPPAPLETHPRHRDRPPPRPRQPPRLPRGRLRRDRRVPRRAKPASQRPPSVEVAPAWPPSRAVPTATADLFADVVLHVVPGEARSLPFRVIAAAHSHPDVVALMDRATGRGEREAVLASVARLIRRTAKAVAVAPSIEAAP